MKLKFAAVLVLSILVFVSSLGAASAIDIHGLQIPLMEGSRQIQKQSAGAQMHVAAYSLNKPLAEVVDFYSSFLKENGFLLIGGKDEGGLNVSAKKGAVMFTLRIFSAKGLTIIELIW